MPHSKTNIVQQQAAPARFAPGVSDMTIKVGHVVSRTAEEYLIQKDVNLVLTRNRFVQFVESLTQMKDMLKEREDSELWRSQFSSSADVLEDLFDEIADEYRSGRTIPIG